MPRPTKLVLLHLAGGFDWHEVLVPLDHPRYQELRPTLAWRAEDCLNLSAGLYLNRYLQSWHGLMRDRTLRFHLPPAAPTETHFQAELAMGEWVTRITSEILGPPGLVAPLYYNTRTCPHFLEKWLEKSSPLFSEPRGRPLSTALHAVGSQLSAATSSEVYYLRVNGFDTHYNQKAVYAKLLPTLAADIADFHRRVARSDLRSSVVTVGFSEFGRALAENCQGGSDHSPHSRYFVLCDPS